MLQKLDRTSDCIAATPLSGCGIPALCGTVINAKTTPVISAEAAGATPAAFAVLRTSTERLLARRAAIWVSVLCVR